MKVKDDLLVFATSRGDTIRLLEELVTSLAQVGLKLNTSKTKILTTEAQPGKILRTSSGVTVEILDSRCAHKWLGCMLQANLGGNRDADLQHHLQAASRAFHANRSILTNHQVSVKDRLTFFHFGSSHFGSRLKRCAHYAPTTLAGTVFPFALMTGSPSREDHAKRPRHELGMDSPFTPLLNRQHANGYAPLEDENVDRVPLCPPDRHHQSEGLVS